MWSPVKAACPRSRPCILSEDQRRTGTTAPGSESRGKAKVSPSPQYSRHLAQRPPKVPKVQLTAILGNWYFLVKDYNEKDVESITIQEIRLPESKTTRTLQVISEIQNIKRDRKGQTRICTCGLIVRG